MKNVSLGDKNIVETGHAFLAGVQALTLLSLLQRRRDLAARQTRQLRESLGA